MVQLALDLPYRLSHEVPSLTFLWWAVLALSFLLGVAAGVVISSTLPGKIVFACLTFFVALLCGFIWFGYTSIIVSVPSNASQIGFLGGLLLACFIARRSNNSFKPNPLRSFKTPSGFSGGSA